MASSAHSWLGELYRLYHSELVRYASRLVGNRDSGEEVIQNAYLKMAIRSSGGIEVSQPKAYAYAAARTAAYDFSAQQHREWLHRVEIEDIQSLASTDQQTTLDHRKRIVKLAVLLNELPGGCRTAFILNKVEGRRHREIAERMGISVSMVEKHIVRALIHLRNFSRDE